MTIVYGYEVESSVDVLGASVAACGYHVELLLYKSGNWVD